MRPILVHRADRPLDQLPAEPLMESFDMGVRHEFIRHVPMPNRLDEPRRSYCPMVQAELFMPAAQL